MSKIKIAVIGCGPRATNGHLPAIQRVEKLELVGVCDIDEELARKTAEEFGVPCYIGHKELLEKSDAEAVCIVTATRFHAAIAKDALNAGKHVLCEKPLADNLKDAKEVLDIAAEKGLKGMVSYQLRFHPFFVAYHENAARLEPVQYYGSRQIGIMGEKYLKPDDMCGLSDFTSHDIDLALWMMGGKPKAVNAVLMRGTFTDTGAIDVLNAQIEFDGKRTATLLSSMGGRGVGARFDLIGKQGNITASGMTELKVTTYNGRQERGKPVKTEVVKIEPTKGDTTDRLLQHFADYIQSSGEFPARATFEDGFNALLIARAIIESDRTGNRVDLQEFLARELS